MENVAAQFSAEGIDHSKPITFNITYSVHLRNKNVSFAMNILRLTEKIRLETAN